MLPVVLLLVRGVADGDAMRLAVITILLVTGVASYGFNMLLVAGFASDQHAVGYIYMCCQWWCSSAVWSPCCWLQVLPVVVVFSCVITLLLAIVLPVVVFFQLWVQYAFGYRCCLWCFLFVFSGVWSPCCWLQVLPVVMFFSCVIMLLVTGVASGGVLQLCDHAVGYRCCQWWCSSAVWSCCWLQVLPVVVFFSCDHAVGYRCCQWWCSSAVWSPCCTTWASCSVSSTKLPLSWGAPWVPLLPSHSVRLATSL